MSTSYYLVSVHGMVMENRPVDLGSIPGSHRPISFIRTKHRTRANDFLCDLSINNYQVYGRFSSQKPYYTNVSDVSRSLQSWVSTIQTVVLTADVFQLFIKKYFFFSRIYTISSICMVGNSHYGKGPISRTEPVLLQALRIWFKVTFTPVFFVQVPRNFDAFFNPKKRFRKGRWQHHSAIYWSTWKTYEFWRHRRCLTLNFGDNGSHFYSRRFKALTEPCVA